MNVQTTAPIEAALLHMLAMTIMDGEEGRLLADILPEGIENDLQTAGDHHQDTIQMKSIVGEHHRLMRLQGVTTTTSTPEAPRRHLGTPSHTLVDPIPMLDHQVHAVEEEVMAMAGATADMMIDVISGIS